MTTTVTADSPTFTAVENGLSRADVVNLIWPGDNPIDHPTSYPTTILVTSADTHRIDYAPGFASRIRWWYPPAHDGRRFAIYHEGHAPDNLRTPEGLATRDWLLSQGWAVVYMDMPLRGINWKDQKPGLIDHEDFETLAANWAGAYHPLGLFLEPVAHVVNLIYQQATDEPLIMMTGRSGGGWTTLWYAALDPRIDLAVVIAGFTPLQIRDRPTLDGGQIKPGDWEQNVSSIYDHVSYEDLVNLLTDRPVLYLYGQYDPCCFDLTPDEDYVTWLRQRGGVFVDPTWDQHGVSPAQYQVWSSFLRWLGKG
jgi:hypothetical protein